MNIVPNPKPRLKRKFGANKGIARVSTNPANVAAKKKRKKTKADIKREWGIDPKYTLRYESPVEKGILWYWFARYIRMRDFLMYGTCITCGNPKTFAELQAGHFMPAGRCGLELLFDETNVNGECEGCNGFDETHLLKYGRNLDKRYGTNTAAILEERYELRNQVHTNYKKSDYLKMASECKAQFELLVTERI